MKTRRQADASRRARTEPNLGSVSAKPNPAAGRLDGQALAVDVIRAHFVALYRPVFRRGNAVVCEDGATVTKGNACEVGTSALMARLACAPNAPSFKGGGVNLNALPAFFKTWAPVAWGDLLAVLPDEDTAELGADAPARDEFRRLVREALLTQIVLGDVIGKTEVLQTERRSLIDWCVKFAKPGPWKTIRSYRCWCRCDHLDGGELIVRVAVRHELFSQLRADRRLCEMGANTFGRRAARYAVGKTDRDDRPHGMSAVVLNPAFLSELTGATPPDADEPDVLEFGRSRNNQTPSDG